MAHDTQALSIEPGAWGDAADFWIAQALQHATPGDIRHQVEQGGASLFYIRAGVEIVGAFVLRIDQLPGGFEGVIVAAAAKVQGVDMIATCLPEIENKFIGCKTIRYHTARPELARYLSAWGYAAREIVCRKELKNVH